MKKLDLKKFIGPKTLGVVAAGITAVLAFANALDGQKKNEQLKTLWDNYQNSKGE